MCQGSKGVPITQRRSSLSTNCHWTGGGVLCFNDKTIHSYFGDLREGSIQETTCVYKRSSLRLTSAGTSTIYTELMEVARMFRSTVDGNDVRQNSMELDGSL